MITKEQALTHSKFHENNCTRVIGLRGAIRERSYVWRRTGATKTWKTRPGEFRMPIKYGASVKSCDYLTHANAWKLHVPEDCPLNDPKFVTEDLRKYLQKPSLLFLMGACG